MMNIERPHFFGLLAGLFLAAELVLSSMVVTRAWIKLHEAAEISVTGSARKDVRSDLIIWRGSFQVEAPTLVGAQEKWESSTETSSEGVNNITSDEKTIHAVVSASFALK